MNAFLNEIIDIYFIAVILVYLIVLAYSINISKQNKVKNPNEKKIRNAYRLKWLTIPQIIVSAFILILRFLIPQMNRFPIDPSLVPISLITLIFFPLIPIYIKYDKNELQILNFLNTNSNEYINRSGNVSISNKNEIFIYLYEPL